MTISITGRRVIRDAVVEDSVIRGTLTAPSGAHRDFSRCTNSTPLEQQVVDLRLQLDERDQELAAARGANREMIAQINGARHAG